MNTDFRDAERAELAAHLASVPDLDCDAGDCAACLGECGKGDSMTTAAYVVTARSDWGMRDLGTYATRADADAAMQAGADAARRAGYIVLYLCERVNGSTWSDRTIITTRL